MFYTFRDIYHFSDWRIQYNLLLRSHKLRVTWIPKNMCSSIKLSIAAATGLIKPDMVSGFINNPHWIHNWTWPLEPKNAYDLTINGLISIAVIRNPVSRLQSAIIEKTFFENDQFYTIIQPIINHYTHYIKIDPDDFTFRHLIEYLSMAPDRMLDQHFISQVSFLSGNYDYLLPFERPETINQLFASFGIQLYCIGRHSINKDSHEYLDVCLDNTINGARLRYLQNPGLGIKPDMALQDEIRQLALSRYTDDFHLWLSCYHKPSW